MFTFCFLPLSCNLSWWPDKFNEYTEDNAENHINRHMKYLGRWMLYSESCSLTILAEKSYIFFTAVSTNHTTCSFPWQQIHIRTICQLLSHLPNQLTGAYQGKRYQKNTASDGIRAFEKEKRVILLEQCVVESKEFKTRSKCHLVPKGFCKSLLCSMFNVQTCPWFTSLFVVLFVVTMPEISLKTL